MSTELDDKLVPKAKQMLTDFGQSATYKSIAIGGDPLEGDFTETATEYTIKIVPPRPIDTYVFNETYRATDMQTLIAAQDIAFTPVVGDKITIKSVDYEIISSQPVYSGEEIAIYKFILRD